MADVTLTVDGHEVRVPAGSTILEAARGAGVYVPALCSHPALPRVEHQKGEARVFRGADTVHGDDPGGEWDGCGICAVEADGELTRACASEALGGMSVVTDSDPVVARRRERLAVVLTHHPHACLSCAQAEGCPRTQCSSNVPEDERCCELLGSCELGRIAHFVGLPGNLPRYRNRGFPTLTDDPLFDFDTELCVGCLRCVRACQDLRGVGTLGFTLVDGRPVVGTLGGPTRSEGHCRFCGACVEVCPTGALLDRNRARGDDRERALVPCRNACPAGIDIPRLVRHIARDEPAQAAAVVREKVPLAWAASYTCFHPCEDLCRRSDVSDPVSVCRLKRYALDAGDDTWQSRVEKRPASGKNVAVVGGGPAGLTAAWYLAVKGHAVTLHESLPEPGGMLRVGIPEYRFPRELLERDLDEVRRVGVDIRCNSPVDGTIFDELVAGSDAVFVATGAHGAKRIDIPGKELDGVHWGVDFLRRRAGGELAVDLFEKRDVVVIGGGNVAVDAARVALRLGAGVVTLVSLEAKNELPAWDWEVEETRDEGIGMLHSFGPDRVLGDEDGKVTGLRLRRCTRVFDEHGLFNPAFDEAQLREVPADAVIVAIGQEPSSGPFRGLGLGAQKTIEHNEETLATRLGNVWTGGDVAAGPGSFIEAVAMGRTAAVEMDRALGGDGDIDMDLVDRVPAQPLLGPIEGFRALGRVQPRMADAETRADSFGPVEDTLTPEMARAEALRCLNCDLRLAMEPAPVPPPRESRLELSGDVVAALPTVEGVFQLLDEDHAVIAIKGVMDLREGLTEAMEENDMARFFVYEEDPMFTKRESELIQQYLQEHGELPGGGDDELDDLF